MSEHVAHTETYKGLTLKIILDEHGGTDSPVEDGANAVIFAVLHRRYENPADKGMVHKDNGEDLYDFTTPEGIAEFEQDNAGPDAPWAVFPLFLYDHSGTSYRASEGGNPFNCPWDSGRVGIIALKKSEVGTPGKEYGTGEHKHVGKSYLDQANDTCKGYTDWANGNVFGWVVEDETGETLESCWGYIGDHDTYVLEEGRRVLKALAKDHEPVAEIKLTRSQARFLFNELPIAEACSATDAERLMAVSTALMEAFPGIENEEVEEVD